MLPRTSSTPSGSGSTAVTRAFWYVYSPCCGWPSDGTPTLSSPQVTISPPPNDFIQSSHTGAVSPTGDVQENFTPPNHASPASSPRSGSSRRSIPPSTRRSIARQPAALPSATTDEIAVAFMRPGGWRPR